MENRARQTGIWTNKTNLLWYRKIENEVSGRWTTNKSTMVVVWSKKKKVNVPNFQPLFMEVPAFYLPLYWLCNRTRPGWILSDFHFHSEHDLIHLSVQFLFIYEEPKIFVFYLKRGRQTDIRIPITYRIVWKFFCSSWSCLQHYQFLSPTEFMASNKSSLLVLQTDYFIMTST